MNPHGPVPCVWNGEAFEPLKRFAQHCDRVYAVGELYPLVVHEERSAESHKHYFAAVNEAWKNLPHDVTAERFPTAEHLRKWALIKAGYADVMPIACASRAEALRAAAMARGLDEFAVVAIVGATVQIYRAQSQSQRAMGKKAFQESKTRVLDIVAAMIGVDSATLTANTRRAA